MARVLHWDGSLPRKVEQTGKRVLFQAAQVILDTSNDMVPHEYGDLEISGEVHVTARNVMIVYDMPYAYIQHENLSYQHNAGRSAKYLEKAVEIKRRTVSRMLQAQLGQVFR